MPECLQLHRDLWRPGTIRSLAACLLLMSSIGLTLTAAAELLALLGMWRVQDRQATIEIYRCEDRYCGRIAWLKEPLFAFDDDGGMAGRLKIDRNNPDIARRSDPVLGKVILSGLRFNGAIWKDGRLYDHESGATFRCTAALMAGNRLAIRGYVGLSLFRRTETRMRVTPHD